MSWQEDIEKTEIKNPERFKERFRMLVFNVRNKPSAYENFRYNINLGDGIITKVKDTIYIVPTELKEIFKKIKNKMDGPFGFTVLASSSHGIRVCCFGIKQNLLGKALI